MRALGFAVGWLRVSALTLGFQQGASAGSDTANGHLIYPSGGLYRSRAWDWSRAWDRARARYGRTGSCARVRKRVTEAWRRTSWWDSLAPLLHQPGSNLREILTKSRKAIAPGASQDRIGGSNCSAGEQHDGGPCNR